MEEPQTFVRVAALGMWGEYDGPGEFIRRDRDGGAVVRFFAKGKEWMPHVTRDEYSFKICILEGDQAVLDGEEIVVTLVNERYVHYQRLKSTTTD